MHLATVGQVSDAGTTPLASLQLTVANAVAAGNRVIIAVETNALSTQDGVFSATDNRGNTYTVPNDAGQTSPLGLGHEFKSGTTQISILSSVLGTGLQVGDHITVAHASANVLYWGITAEAFDDTTAFDTLSHNTGASNSPSSGPAPAADQNAQLVFVATSWGGSGVPTVPSGWDSSAMVEAAGASNRRLQAHWQYVNVGGTRSGALALGTSGSWAQIVSAWDAALPPQVLEPISDVTTTNWVKNGGTGSFASLMDEAVPDDTDFARSASNPAGQVLELLAAPGVVPPTFTQFKVRARCRLNGSSGSVVLKLMDGASVVAASSALPVTAGSFGWYDFTLTSTQASGINTAHYANLRPHLEATASP